MLKKFFAMLSLVLLLSVPIPAQTVSGTVTFTATAIDPVPVGGGTSCGVQSVQFFNGTTAMGPAITTPTSGNDYVFSLNTRTMANGSYTITAKATDKAGVGTSQATLCDGSKPNVGTSSPITLVVNNAAPDTTAPTVSIIVIVTVP
jgi:hypothetical protein